MPRFELRIPEVSYARKVVEANNMEAAIHLARYGSGDYDAEGEITVPKFKPGGWVQVMPDDGNIDIWIRELE